MMAIFNAIKSWWEPTDFQEYLKKRFEGYCGWRPCIVDDVNSILLLLRTHYSNKPPETNKAIHTPPSSQSIKSLFMPSIDVSISLKSFFVIYYHPNCRRPVFCLALNSCWKGTIFCNLSSFICRTCPSHLNLSLNVVFKSRIEPHFPLSLLFEIWSVSWGPKPIYSQFL